MLSGAVPGRLLFYLLFIILKPSKIYTMNIYKTTVTIPKPVEEVFKYITTPENFPKWKKDVWIAGKKYGEPGPGFKMVQTVHLMCPRQFMMHVTGYETNRYFKFEARKGFVILPAWEFSFE